MYIYMCLNFASLLFGISSNMYNFELYTERKVPRLLECGAGAPPTRSIFDVLGGCSSVTSPSLIVRDILFWGVGDVLFCIR